MSIASLSTPAFDLNGSVKLDLLAESQISRVGRRAIKSATLDGDNVISQGGYNAADATITLNFEPTQTQDEAIRRLIKLYPTLILTTRNSAYSGVILDYSLSERTGEAALQFEPEQVLSDG